MKIVNFAPLNAQSVVGSPSSSAIDASQIVYCSAQVVTASLANTPSLTVKLQASNDIPPASNMPQTFVPTNWSDVPSAVTSAITANGVVLIPKTDLCYRWLRVVVTTTTGTGNVTVNLMGICV